MFFGEYDRDMDIAVQREEAWEEGMEHGVAVGIAERNVDIARRMLENNAPVEDIMLYTGLSLEEIEALRQS